MSDIVQQLRQGAITTDDYRWEAADLIESLRQKTQYWPDNAERDAVIRHQKGALLALRAYNERLRAALSEIAKYEIEEGCPCNACQHSAIARAALEQY